MGKAGIRTFTKLYKKINNKYFPAFPESFIKPIQLQVRFLIELLIKVLIASLIRILVKRRKLIFT